MRKDEKGCVVTGREDNMRAHLKLLKIFFSFRIFFTINRRTSKIPSQPFLFIKNETNKGNLPQNMIRVRGESKSEAVKICDL